MAMNAVKWADSKMSRKMLLFAQRDTVRGSPLGLRVTDRKARLFVCACCRLVWDKLVDAAVCPDCDGSRKRPADCMAAIAGAWEWCETCNRTGRVNRSKRAVETAELFADGLATKKELRAAFSSAHAAWLAFDNPAGLARYAAHSNGFYAAKQITRPDLTGIDRGAQAALLRDILGSPHTAEPVVKPRASWTSSNVSALALTIYIERAWDRMPILADALEDAGCTDMSVLDHCRQPMYCNAWCHDDGNDALCRTCCGPRKIIWPHTRGCHVVDCILRKE